MLLPFVVADGSYEIAVIVNSSISRAHHCPINVFETKESLNYDVRAGRSNHRWPLLDFRPLVNIAICFRVAIRYLRRHSKNMKKIFLFFSKNET